MVKIVYTYPDGRSMPVDVAAGTSVMQAAVGGGIDGIIGECGGNAMCATCHVYTDIADAGRLPPVGDDEDEMLDCTAAERAEGSRLSCQLVAGPELDGLVVRLPAEQM
jgi:ferredoxin, 2Fe-2S